MVTKKIGWRLKLETIRKTKEIKKVTKLKTYDAVINYLFRIREKYIKFKK